MYARKSLGQHFLNSPAAIKAIIDAGQIKKDEIILEIGPGRGVLTGALLQKTSRVIAVEKDSRLMPVLQQKFTKEITSGELTLVSADILNFSLTDDSPLTTHYKLIANIPYYLTGAIFRKFLETENQPEKMVLLVQKEVADRILARDNKESLLSLSVKAFGKPKYIKTVKAGSFNPPPKVDSAILAIDEISRDFFKDCSEKIFFKLIHLGFAHKRKQLVANLAGSYKREKITKILGQLELSPTIRAEDLKIKDWQQLAKLIA
ncbi:MAG: 16S rRNA (adenine(1518)-N(6)/adenine(1519)-N(6))-dimethyltransferase RsmA [Candidatus Paceibacterota bacterium]|jgi:16S rRNA (adenine1518-N6/adenine1519-N6)-dimethyltransferase